MMIFKSNQKKSLQNLARLPDSEVIAVYRKRKDPEIVGILFTRYSHLVFGLSLKYMKDEDEAKDVVMEIFEKLPDDLLKHEIQNFKSWLFSVSRNHCLMRIRSATSKQKHLDNYRIETEQEFMESSISLHQEHKEALNNKEQKLREAIGELNEEQKICVELVYLQDKSYNEVSEITGYSLKKVKSYVQNAKRNLKIKLEDKIGKEE